MKLTEVTRLALTSSNLNKKFVPLKKSKDFINRGIPIKPKEKLKSREQIERIERLERLQFNRAQTNRAKDHDNS